MSEWRTPEQVKADDELSLAITNTLRAYNEGDLSEYVLIDYVVITAMAGVSDDKANHTKYDYLLSEGSIPYHRMIGLVSWGSDAMRDSMKGLETDE